MAEIRNWHTGEVIYKGPGTVAETLSAGVKNGISFAYADLSGAGLSGAILINGDLLFADLRNTDLRNTKLCGAKLRYADLRGADLRGADLTGAMLRDAKLSNTDLGGANLCFADLRDTLLPDNVPVIVSLHQCVYAATSKLGALDIPTLRLNWAGHIVSLAGDAGCALKQRFGTNTAAALIFAKSDTLEERVPDWYSSNEAALTDIKRLAEAEAALNTGANG